MADSIADGILLARAAWGKAAPRTSKVGCPRPHPVEDHPGTRAVLVALREPRSCRMLSQYPRSQTTCPPSAESKTAK